MKCRPDRRAASTNQLRICWSITGLTRSMTDWHPASHYRRCQLLQTIHFSETSRLEALRHNQGEHSVQRKPIRPPTTTE